MDIFKESCSVAAQQFALSPTQCLSALQWFTLTSSSTGGSPRLDVHPQKENEIHSRASPRHKSSHQQLSVPAVPAPVDVCRPRLLLGPLGGCAAEPGDCW